MADSETDYLEIITSLLQSPEWHHPPEIIRLSFTAILALLNQYHQNFQQHKHLINEQSLKIKEVEIRLSAKVSKKQMEQMIQKQQFQDEDSLAEYQTESHNNMNIEQMKTVADLMICKHLESFKIELQKSRQKHQNLEIEFAEFKSDLTHQLSIKDQELKHISATFQTEIKDNPMVAVQEQIEQFEHSQKRMTESINHIISHLQANYHRKEEIVDTIRRQLKELERQREKEQKRQKEERREKGREQFERIEGIMKKQKMEESKEWNDFKMKILKQTNQIVKLETIQHLLESFRKQVSQKYQQVSHQISLLQHKIASIPKVQVIKQTVVQQNKERQKPKSTLQSITNSITRIEKSLSQKGNSIDLESVESLLSDKLNAYNKQLQQQLEIRERHMCEIIEETYKQAFQPNINIPNNILNTNMYARYLYLGNQECKKDSCIQWQQQSINNLIDNFKWKKNQSYIMIQSPGLYDIQAVLFGSLELQAHLLLNNDPIAIFYKKEEPKVTGVKSRGALFSQPIIIAAKSKLSIRVSQNFYGHAFLQLRLM